MCSSRILKSIGEPNIRFLKVLPITTWNGLFRKYDFCMATNLHVAYVESSVVG